MTDEPAEAPVDVTRWIRDATGAAIRTGPPSPRPDPDPEPSERPASLEFSDQIRAAAKAVPDPKETS